LTVVFEGDGGKGSLDKDRKPLERLGKKDYFGPKGSVEVLTLEQHGVLIGPLKMNGTPLTITGGERSKTMKKLKLEAGCGFWGGGEVDKGKKKEKCFRFQMKGKKG